MKSIIFQPKQSLKSKKYYVNVGKLEIEFSSFRMAKQEAERLSKLFNNHLIELNSAYSNFLNHSRKCWLMDAPFIASTLKAYQELNYHFMMAVSNANNYQPLLQLTNISQLLQEHFLMIKTFYSQRNHHILAAEVSTLMDTLSRVEANLSTFHLEYTKVH